MSELVLEGVPSLDDLEAELEMRDLVRFVPKVSPKYMAPTHLAPLLRRFELAAEGIPQRVCCSAPPRHAKTESVLHVPAFVLRRHPEKTISYSTYGDRLSRKGSRKARAIVRRLGIETTGTINEWRTEDGGGVLAGGVGGPLTGYGIDIAIIDDPVKNRVEAESATYRARLSDWKNDVLTTRIEPGGSIFAFMTRWHPDDLIGELVSEGYEYINLPALDADEQPLWPERWSREAMMLRREEVGDYTWSSLYQGQPRPRGAAVFNDVHTYESLPVVYRVAGGVDSAYSQKKTSDFSAYVKMLRAGDRYYVVDAARVREPMPQFKARLWVVHSAHPSMRWRWYVATSELGAADLLADGENAAPVRGEVAKADKFIRALQYAAAWNAGKVLLPRIAPWLNDFVAEHAGFTGVNDKRDDLVDAAVAAFDELNGEASTGPIAATHTSRPAMAGL